MPTLDQLPIEILADIISRLLDDFPAVAALSSQCRRLHSLCDFHNRRKYRRIRIRTESHREKAFQILLSILRKPQLGQYVRHMEFDLEPLLRAPTYTIAGWKRHLPDDDITRLRNATRNAGFIDADEEWIMDMLMQDQAAIDEERDLPFKKRKRETANFMEHAIAALLISVSPQLESLVLSPPYRRYTDFFPIEDPEHYLYQTGVKRPLPVFLYEANEGKRGGPYLQHLRSVTFFTDFRENYGEGVYWKTLDLFGAMALVHKLPSIETISVQDLTENENGKDGIEPMSSNISRVRILHADLGTTVLTTVLGACKQLREFTYTTHGRVAPDQSYHALKYPPIFKALLHHRTTLEVLDFDCGDVFDIVNQQLSRNQERFMEGNVEYGGGGWIGPPADVWGETGALRDFTALTHLTLHVNLLFYYARGIPGSPSHTPSGEQSTLVHQLPPNLQYLCILDYRPGKSELCDREINELRQHKDDLLPRLTKVKGIEEYVPCQVPAEYPEEEPPSPELEDWSEHEY